MGREIERKFLVSGDAWRQLAAPVLLVQGYLSSQPERIVRVRAEGAHAWLTVKGLTAGAQRREFEYPIPLEDAREMLASLCERPLLEKRRSRVPHGGLVWEIDEFLGENTGLIVAEVEVPAEDHPVALPEWAGREVTGDVRFYNSNLLAHPFRNWANAI